MSKMKRSKGSAKKQKGHTKIVEKSDKEKNSDSDYSGNVEEEIHYEKQRLDLLTDMTELEGKFNELKKKLHEERVAQLDAKKLQIERLSAVEYTGPFNKLDDEKEIHLQVTEFLKDLELVNAKNKYESGVLSAEQTFEAEQKLIYYSTKQNILNWIDQLEADKNTLDVMSDWSNAEDDEYFTNSFSNKRSLKSQSESSKKRKTKTLVSPPYIVYMLDDSEIIDDWTNIRRGLRHQDQDWRSNKNRYNSENSMVPVRYENSRVFFENAWFAHGHEIDIFVPPKTYFTHALIVSVTKNEIWIRRQDEKKSKISLYHIQNGRYHIKHSSESATTEQQ